MSKKSEKQNSSDGAGQFDVILTDVGPAKMGVIGVVRAATGLGHWTDVVLGVVK